MDYIEAFKNLKTNYRYSRKTPHKAILLLTVIEMYETNVLSDNVIVYDDVLKRTFRKVWERSLPNESLYHPEAYLPFWYMQSEGFWHIVPNRGDEEILILMRDNDIKPSELKLKECVNYAELDIDLFFLMTLPSGRSSLKRALLETYTDLTETEINELSQSVDNSIDYSVSAFSDYERILSENKEEVIVNTMEVDNGLIGQFQKLNEDVQLVLNIQYYSFLKSHRVERELLKEICPTVYDLYDKIVNHPVKREDLAPSFAIVYDNFLSDLRISLMSEDGSMELINKLLEAVEILRNKQADNQREEPINEHISPEPTLFNLELEKDKEDDKGIGNDIILTREIIESACTPNGGYTKSQLAAIGIPWPRPSDWIEQVVGKRITPEQLEGFRRIEYVTHSSSSSTSMRKEVICKDFAKDSKERKRMKAILRVIKRFQLPMTPRELAYEVSWDDWGGCLIRPNDVEELLRRMPEIQAAKNGKYQLRKEGCNDIESLMPTEFIDNSKNSNETSRRGWRFKEERDLVNFFNTGMTIAQLAQFFDRDEGSIIEKLRQKGLLK